MASIPQNGAQGEDPRLEPIAICGMSCRLPGGVNSASSFWEMLVEKRSGQTPKVPASRFNIDAHYHPNLERPGSFNVAGGYFLDGRLEDFDPTAFNMTPIEAQWLDPQQRKMLEVSYECLESAGLTLDAVAGSNTAVFIGSFTSDYQQMSIRDPDFRHNYAATGVDPGIISNRIGNTFNLKGPSFTINTACSSSVYATHNACLALQARDCDAAIVGGVNLIITVDQHMNTAKLGILSPTSTCHTFDASADGYGRGEAVGALYLKRLSDAIRDGDPVRGVIRATAVNTNGKVEGMGITHPSVKGQEAVVRKAYARGGLDMNRTAYAELHGTGTPVGDPIEVRAVSNALNDTRSREKPLLLGAVKPNIGHSEAASGIFAIMKAALMTESGIIPGIAGFQRLNPKILESEWNVKVNSDTAPWPSGFDVRRASVSSFGYGGTNGHVVVEAIDSLYPWHQHAKPKHEAPYDRSYTRPFLLCFSAHDKATLTRNVAAIKGAAHKYYLADLSYTLNMRRTRYAHRTFAIAREEDNPDSFSTVDLKFGIAPNKTPKLGFIFTGQGAQWAGMGRAALKEFPNFLGTIRRLDNILARLDPAPSWTLESILLPEDGADTSEVINQAEISQPICTAIQIAIVDLLAGCKITSSVNVGHSSGEIAAAYAAGLISAPGAILAAYCRGLAVKEHSIHGTMLAVGLGADGLQQYMAEYSPEELCIACENSPNSVSLSGSPEAVGEIKRKLDEDKIFARELRTGRAYHSPHMAPVGAAYEKMLSNALTGLDQGDLSWRQPRSAMISSVTGELLDTESGSLPPAYWSSNLRQRVLFNSAIRVLGLSPDFKDVKTVVEIGPHSALAGPFKQICLANKFDHGYIPSLVRKQNDVDQLLSIAGSLFIANYPVDLEAVNATEEIPSRVRKPGCQRLLVDLPPYQWNYEKRYWAEPRASAEQRTLTHPRHDLLGSRLTGLSSHSCVWQNRVRHHDIPWLKDHTLGNAAVFPAAGHMSLAIEALRQVCETERLPFGEVTLRDVDIKTALIIPDVDDGVEVQLRLERLQPASDGNDNTWYSFCVESLFEGSWISHCQGKIAANHHAWLAVNASETTNSPVDSTRLMQRVPGKRWYNAFHRVGFNYGPAFQQLGQIRTDLSCHEAAAEVMVREDSGVIDGESRYIIHPSTVDACLQLIIISIHAGNYSEMPWGVVPIRIEEVSLFFPGSDSGVMGKAVAWTDRLEGRYFNTHTKLMGQSGRLLMDVKSLRCVSYEAAVPANALTGSEPEPFSAASWKPDILALDTFLAQRLWPTNVPTEAAAIGQLVDLINHRQTLGTVLLCGYPSVETISSILSLTPKSTTVILGSLPGYEVDLSQVVEAYGERIVAKVLAENPDDWDENTKGPHDVVVVDEDVLQDQQHMAIRTALATAVRAGGWIIASVPGQADSPLSEDLFGRTAEPSVLELAVADPKRGRRQISVFKEKNIGAYGARNVSITVLAAEDSDSDEDLIRHITAHGHTVIRKPLREIPGEANGTVVIDDREGNLLDSLDSTAFENLKFWMSANLPVLWLTRGVKQGKSVHGGMAEGFIRVIRSEQAASRIILLDFDAEETLEDVCRAISDKLSQPQTKPGAEDTEFWLHDGVTQICRVLPNGPLNSEYYSNSSAVRPVALPSGTSLTPRIADGQLTFQQAQRPTSDAGGLEVGEIDVQVTASELQVAPGAPIVVAGIVLRCGPLVDDDLIGHPVVAFTGVAFSTTVRTAVFTKVDDTDNLASLAGDISALSKVVNMCLITSRCQSADRILALPGPAPVLHMLARVSKLLSWDLTVVAASVTEQMHYITKLGLQRAKVLAAGNRNSAAAALQSAQVEASGRTIVIAHDFGSLSQEIWRCCSSSTRFILSDCQLETAPDPLPFARGASLIPTNSRLLINSSEVLEHTVKVLKTYPRLAGFATAAYDIGAVEDVGRLTKEVPGDKVGVLVYRYGESVVKVQAEHPPFTLSPDATYLLVGCLGGLGRSLVKWMMEHGARHFAFVSRSGVDKREALMITNSLVMAGASVKAFRADAADEAAMTLIVQETQLERPIRGVVHAAMVLRDGIFEQMDYSSFKAAIEPKVQGALSLHKALQDVDLDFFVMTSSISATLGNPGQANYSAANSFLDTLAWHRNLNHQAGTSLVLPMILDVGVVAENEGIEESLVRKGMYGIDEQEMLRGFEVAMSRPIPLKDQDVKRSDSQIILGLDPKELAKAITSGEAVDAYWYDDARFATIRATIEAMTRASSGSGSSDFASLLKAVADDGPEAILAVIANQIAKRVSSILLMDMESFDLDGPSIASYGIDSMIGAEMRNWLFKAFGLEFPFPKLLSPSLTFKALATVVAVHIGLLPE